MNGMYSTGSLERWNRKIHIAEQVLSAQQCSSPSSPSSTLHIRPINIETDLWAQITVEIQGGSEVGERPCGQQSNAFPLEEGEVFYFFGGTAWHLGSYFPEQGSNLCSLRWKHRLLTTGPPEKVMLEGFRSGQWDTMGTPDGRKPNWER